MKNLVINIQKYLKKSIFFLVTLFFVECVLCQDLLCDIGFKDQVVQND